MPITFETEWVAADEIRGPELASTWASLLIRVDDSVITRVLDQRARTVRDRIYVPLYPLAESLVTNWWFLLHEVGNPVKSDDHSFKRRHALVSARDGYAFPKLHVASSGGRVLLAWMPDSFLWTRIEYRGRDELWIDKNEFRASCTDLVDRVVRRLAACGVEGTLLQEEWGSIHAADRDERLFCKTAAGLGWDLYALNDVQRAAVLGLEDVLDQAILEEAVAVLDGARLEEQATAIAATLEPGRYAGLPLEHLRAACPRPAVQVEGGSPWSAGYALARDVRQRMGLDDEPLPSMNALGEALRENPAALAQATRARNLGGADLVNGVVTADADGLPAFALRDGPASSRRFHFCRGLAEVLTSPGSPALLTQARSDRQQRSRAFAAEFLAPATALAVRVRRPIVDEEDVDGLAAEFGVSPWLIAHQLENHQIARIW